MRWLTEKACRWASWPGCLPGYWPACLLEWTELTKKVLRLRRHWMKGNSSS